MAGRTGSRSGCTAIILLLAALAVSAGTDGTEPAQEAGHAPPTQFLSPFVGSDDGWERISLRSSVDRMMDDPEQGDVEDQQDDFSMGSSDPQDEDDDFSDFDDDSSEEGDSWASDDMGGSDPLVKLVLPESYKAKIRAQARHEARLARPHKPSTRMEDNPLVSKSLRKQVQEEMGESPTEDVEPDSRESERAVADILVHERKRVSHHTLSLKKQLQQAKAEAAAAKEKSMKLEKKLRQAEDKAPSKKPLQMKADKGKFVETEKKKKKSKRTLGKAVKKALKKAAKRAKKAAKKAKKKAKKKAAAKKKAKKAAKEAKKLVAKAKRNLKVAKKVDDKTQKRINKWASKQVIDDPEDAVASFKNKAHEKWYKKRVQGDRRNHSGKWANKHDYYTDGYISNNAYLDNKGHYYLGMSRRRIGAGFGRRRRGTGFTPGKWIGKVHAKMLKRIVKGHSLLKVGLKRRKSINGRGVVKKKKLPPGIKEANKAKLTLGEIATLKKTKAGVKAKVDKNAHFTGATIAKIGGKSLAASLGEKAKAAKNTAKLSAKVKKLVESALKKISSKKKKKTMKKVVKAIKKVVKKAAKKKKKA